MRTFLVAVLLTAAACKPAPPASPALGPAEKAYLASISRYRAAEAEAIGLGTPCSERMKAAASQGKDAEFVMNMATTDMACKAMVMKRADARTALADLEQKEEAWYRLCLTAQSQSACDQKKAEFLRN